MNDKQQTNLTDTHPHQDELTRTENRRVSADNRDIQLELGKHNNEKMEMDNNNDDEDNNDDGNSEVPLSSDALNEDRVIRHIMVVGFHHKHGYQVDYCYPPIAPSKRTFSTSKHPITLPNCWRTLPLLCLPDGAHNFDSDTIYFTMPDIENETKHTNSNYKDTETKSNRVDDNGGQQEENKDSRQKEEATSENIHDKQKQQQQSSGVKTIFGTACYRQIQADKLLNRSDDMTRISVQKSVCILMVVPLFGLIRSKLEMITHAYFDELDFSKVDILRLTYDNLNSTLTKNSIKDSSIFLGLSARSLIAQFGNNVLVLYKAMLLEKKILFYKSPVRELCVTILSFCSLFPSLLESGGLNHSACDLQLSPALLEALKLSDDTTDANTSSTSENSKSLREDKVFFDTSKEEVVIICDSSFTDSFQNITKDELDEQNITNIKSSELDENSSKVGTSESDARQSSQGEPQSNDAEQTTDDESHESLNYTDEDQLADGSQVDDPYALKLCRMDPEECGLPLQIFTRGSFCLPYLSISYLDLMADARVKSFVIGATNFLFKQKKDMYDIIVDIDENKIEINDPQLRKCLALTTEDLRFMDYLIKHVVGENSINKSSFYTRHTEDTDFMSQDVTKWVGGDEWIRYHFRLYTMYMLRAARVHNYNMFNTNFMQTWTMITNNYKIWQASGKGSLLMGLKNKHPFSSTNKGLNFSDIKLKFS